MIEEWKPVVGFEDYFLISNMGNVFGLRSSKIIKTPVSYTHLTLPTNREV